MWSIFLGQSTGKPHGSVCLKGNRSSHCKDRSQGYDRKNRDLGFHEKKINHVAVKEVLLPFNKLAGRYDTRTQDEKLPGR